MDRNRQQSAGDPAQGAKPLPSSPQRATATRHDLHRLPPDIPCIRCSILFISSMETMIWSTYTASMGQDDGVRGGDERGGVARRSAPRQRPPKGVTLASSVVTRAPSLMVALARLLCN